MMDVSIESIAAIASIESIATIASIAAIAAIEATSKKKGCHSTREATPNTLVCYEKFERIRNFTVSYLFY